MVRYVSMVGDVSRDGYVALVGHVSRDGYVSLVDDVTMELQWNVTVEFRWWKSVWRRVPGLLVGHAAGWLLPALWRVR